MTLILRLSDVHTDCQTHCDTDSRYDSYRVRLILIVILTDGRWPYLCILEPISLRLRHYDIATAIVIVMFIFMLNIYTRIHTDSDSDTPTHSHSETEYLTFILYQYESEYHNNHVKG